MNKRYLLIVVMAWLCVATPVILAADSAGAQYVEGQHYFKIDPPLPSSTGDKIEVVEIFWYGCPHCFSLEPYIVRWLKTKPANVEFVRIPGLISPKGLKPDHPDYLKFMAQLSPDWLLHARAFYAAEALGVLDKVHEPLFDAIHGKRQPLTSPESLQALFKEHGVAEADFNKAFSNFAMDSKLRRAADLAIRYQIKGVPALIVNGKYRTSPYDAGSNATGMKVLEYLIAQEAGQISK